MTLRKRFFVRMTRPQLDSLTVVLSGTGAELRNCDGFVRWFQDRDAAYLEISRLKSLGARS